MKTIIYTSLLAIALVTFTGCADNEPRHTTVSTTEETEVHHPAVQQSTTVETHRASY